MKLAIQEFLRNFKQSESYQEGFTEFETLKAGYCINSKQHPVYPNLWQFKYDQIESPMGLQICQEARGLILDANNDWAVVAWPFHKFFNYGEGHAAAIDWSSAKIQEKLDGSLIILYHYNGFWQVATTGMPDAGGEVNGFNFTFAELFWEIWWFTMNYDLEHLPTHATYMFELTSMYNRVVVRHSESHLTLIGCRNNLTGQEISIGPGSIHALYFDCAEEYPLSSLEDIQATFPTMDPMQQEGYVVVDKNFNRIKVKCPAYVAIHHLRDGFGPKRMLEIVRQSEQSEFLTYYPEYLPMFNEIKAKYDQLVTEITDKYFTIQHIENQKEFALEATKITHSGCLFGLRNGSIKSVKNYLAEIQIRYLQKSLGLKD